MQRIEKLIRPERTFLSGNVLRRHAARGIVPRDETILLLFTELRVGRLVLV